MMAVDVQMVLTMVTIITFQTQSANAWSKHPFPPSSKARHRGDAMKCFPFRETHGDEEKQVLNCEKAVTYYTDEANAKDEPMLWINLDRRLEVKHCHPNRHMKLCKAQKFDAPFNDIQSYVKNHCINTISNPDTLRELTLKYCSYHSADEAVEMAYNCTTGCQLADQLNQNCRNLKPVVPQQPEISFSPDPVVSGEDFDVICGSNAGSDLKYIFVINDVSQMQQSSDRINRTADINIDVTYTCKVSADGGDTFSSTSDPATPTVVPQQPEISFSAGPVVSGEEFDVICGSNAGSDLKYIFVINDVLQMQQSSDRMTTTADIKTDVTYMCKVSADGGGNFSPISDPARAIVVPQQPVASISANPIVGEVVNFTCNSNAGVELEYTFIGSVDGGVPFQTTEEVGLLPYVAEEMIVFTFSCKVSADGGDNFSETSDPVTKTINESGA